MKILAITSCPVGIAHTYMAAESLEKEAVKRGHSIKVETQGSIGIENEITNEDLHNVDIVILTKDTKIERRERFTGLPVVNISISDAIKKTPAILDAIEKQLAKE